MLFVGGRDGLVHVVDVSQAKILKEYQAHRGRLRALAIDQSGNTLTSVGEDRFVHRKNWQTGEALLSLKLNAGKLLAVEPIDDQRLAIASADNTVQIIDSQTGEEINKLVGHDGSVAVLLYQHGQLFTSGFDTTIRVWDLNLDRTTDKTTKLIRHPIQGRFFDSGVSDSTN
jgi:WD40 repeat protein